MAELGTDNKFEPGPNRIFVFGSNLAGRHGSGAAWDAYKRYGAHYGIGEGLMGSSYALPTKDRDLRSLPLTEIKKYVSHFIEVARENDNLQFFVTRVGCGLAGYTDSEIAPFFKDAPDNCELPPGWRELINSEKI